jgi:ferritin-like metal-binding protein YciE
MRAGIMTPGDYITVGIFVLGLVINGAVYLLAVRSQLQVIVLKQSSLEEDLTQMTAETQNDIKNLAQVVVMQSRHDERITALTQTVVNQGKRLDDTTRRMNTFLDMKIIAKVEDETN